MQRESKHNFKLPKSCVDKLKDLVYKSLKKSECSSALSHVLRVLDYDPHNSIALDEAGFILYGCLTPFHECKEPITKEQRRDQRLDSLFNECSICNKQWFPPHTFAKTFMPGIDPNIVDVSSSYGIGGYCPNCKQAFCQEHVKDPMPSAWKIGERCPNCKVDLNITDVFGRKSNQAPRLNRKLNYILLIREGPIPPDINYCKKMFRLTSIDVFEDRPTVFSMALSPWSNNFGKIIKSVRSWFEANGEIDYYSLYYRTKIWTATDLETNTNFYIAKVWDSEPKITLKNIFEKTQFYENFKFEVAELSEHLQKIEKNIDKPSLRTGEKKNMSIEDEVRKLFERYMIQEIARRSSSGEPTDTDSVLSVVLDKIGYDIALKHNLSWEQARDAVIRGLDKMM